MSNIGGSRIGSRARRALRTVVVLGVLSLSIGCVTARTFNAEVDLSIPVDPICVAKALAAEKDVKEVEKTGEVSFAFQLEEPDTARKNWPAFGLVQGVDAEGAPMLLLTTTFDVGFFETRSENRIARARAIISAVTEACTGVAPTLGATRPCGAGEPHILCAEGR
jgi:hypothetical protein